jgi:predicted  nucleic acid-binding Zn-ribbon protein
MTREDHDEKIREEGFHAGFAAAMQRAREEAEKDAVRAQGLALSLADPKAMAPEEAALMSEMLRQKERADAAEAELVEANARAEGLEAERDHYREALARQTKAAEEALARVKHIEWMQNGAPMKGDGT